MRGPNIPCILRFSHLLNDVLLSFGRLRDFLIGVNHISPAYLGLNINTTIVLLTLAGLRDSLICMNLIFRSYIGSNHI